MILAIRLLTEFKFLSESDNLSGLIDSISYDDLNSLDDLDGLFDLKNPKNTSVLDTEWCFGLSHLESLFFVGLIIKNQVFL